MSDDKLTTTGIIGAVVLALSKFINMRSSAGKKEVEDVIRRLRVVENSFVGESTVKLQVSTVAMKVDETEKRLSDDILRVERQLADHREHVEKNHEGLTRRLDDIHRILTEDALRRAQR